MSFITSSSFDINTVRNRPNGVAGINASKTLLDEHRPVCTKEYHLIGKALFDTQNTDIWQPISGAGGGTIVYSSRFLTLTSGTGAVSATRCVIDQTKFPITSNFIEVTCRIGAWAGGEGGLARRVSIGFQPEFSAYAADGTERAIIAKSSDGSWSVRTKNNMYYMGLLPLGRNLAPGDICTIRLDRREGSPNIDIVRFYVNGQKQYETLDIPTVDCYAGIGVFADSDTTKATSISIDYFGVKYVP